MPTDPFAAIAKPLPQSDPFAAIATPLQNIPPASGPTLGSMSREAALGVASGAGLPETEHPGENLVSGLWHILRHPIDSAQLVGSPIVQGMKDQFGQAQKEFSDAQSAEQGGDRWAMMLKSAQSMSHVLAASVPLVGPAASQAGDEIDKAAQSGDHDRLAHGIGSAVGLLGTLGLFTKTGQKAIGVGTEMVSSAADATVDAARNLPSKLPIIKSFVDGPPTDMLTRAIKPGKNNVGWNDAIASAAPNIKAAEQLAGRPISGLDDAIEATQIAKKSLWQQYKARLGPAAQMGAQIDGNTIADAMVNSVDKRTAVQNPTLVNRVSNVADTYRRPLTVEEAEDFLQSANKDLNNYYAKNKVGRQVALNDPEMASTVAEAEALRNSLYSKLDEISGPGAADLKRQYGALSNVEKEMVGRQNVVGRQQPQSLQEQLIAARGYGKIAKGVLTASPGDVLEGLESTAASKWLKERNTSNALIERAFAKVEPSVPMAAPLPPMISGLLPAGNPPTLLRPSTMTNPMSSAPFVDATTRAQRLGLLLPQKAGGKIPLPLSSLSGQ